MTRPVEPADVVRAVVSGVCRLIAGGLDQGDTESQLDELVDLYAERTDVRHPFAPLGDTPLLTREALRRHFAEAPGQTQGVETFQSKEMIVHRTTDRELVIAEFRYAGLASGRPFEVPCIFVVRVRDGLIVESRDYTDHVALARALGRLGKLAAALAVQDPT